MAKANEYRFDKFNFQDLAVKPSNPIENTLLLYAKGGRFYFLDSLGIETVFPLNVDDIDLSAYAKKFIDLDDAPPTMVGNAGKFIKVNIAEDGLEFTELEITSSFLELTDTPIDYTGQVGKLLSVNATEDGLEFKEQTELVQATEIILGGIKAKAKTTESSEVAIDGLTGKLFAPSSEGGFVPFTEGGYTVEDFEDITKKIPYSGELNRIAGGYNSLFCLSSGNTTVKKSTTFTLDVPVGGIFSFRYKTSFEQSGSSTYGVISFQMDGVQFMQNYTNTNWTLYTMNITAGVHAFKVYVNAGVYAVWFNVSVDDISIPSLGTYNQGINEHSGIPSFAGNAGKIVKVNDTEDGFSYLGRMGTSLPTASVDYRGQYFTLLGGVGVADIVYICMKNASNVYEWVLK